MGQEERKNKAKLEKTQIQLSTSCNEYEATVKVLEETTGRWNRDWKTACDVSQNCLLFTGRSTDFGMPEIPRSRRRANRLHEEQPLEFC